jgi:TrmH family RNA methyltransferase
MSFIIPLSISSRTNPLVQQMARLKDPAFRKKSGLLMAEGLRTVSTMAHSSLVLKYLFVTSETEIHAPSLLQEHTTFIMTNDSVMEKLSASKTPSGIIGIFEQPQYDEETITPPGMVLVGVTDPGNMGTLIRSSVAFAAPTIIVVEGTDPWGTKVIQASAGAIAHAFVHILSWEKVVKIAKQKNSILNALVIDGNPLTQTKAAQQLLVVGNEAHGLTPEQQADCMLRTTIAMPGNTESLNVAVAGSIALYTLLIK